MAKNSKEFLEIEMQINGKILVLDKAVPIVPRKKKDRAFAYLKLEDVSALPSGKLEIWVREVIKRVKK